MELGSRGGCVSVSVSGMVFALVMRTRKILLVGDGRVRSLVNSRTRCEGRFIGIVDVVWIETLLSFEAENIDIYALEIDWPRDRGRCMIDVLLRPLTSSKDIKERDGLE